MPLERIRRFPRRAWRRLRPNATPLALTALAAGGAWFFAELIPGHGRPLFAPIAALVAMIAGRGRRGRQAVELIVGVAFGIALADLLVRGIGVGAWQLVVVVGLTMAVATALGLSPFMVTQSGVWSVIVVAATRGSIDLAATRFVDALVGGGVALVLAQLLFPLDPLRLVDETARAMRADLDEVLRRLAAALRERDETKALDALRRADDVDDRRLASALELGCEVVRRAPRRRPLRRRVDSYHELAGLLRGATRDLRILAVGAIRLIRSDEPVPPPYADALEALARHERPQLPRGEGASLAAGIVEAQIASLARPLEPQEQGEIAKHDERAEADAG
ncbi:MAG TPA: FUSC family protein [Gaiellaceae bacterium]|nr:FUSC family protein [Gaiellaceae bacterium]